MIRRPNDYDNVTPFGQSDYVPLPKGGYICRIIKAEETNDRNGKPMVHIAFDIVEGEFTGYFMNLLDSRRKANTDPTKEVKYPFEGQAWIPVFDYEDASKTSRKFKGFCTAVEDSGTDIWTPTNDLNMDQIKGAEVGVVYQLVEQEYNGKTSWRAVPWGFRSIASIATGDYYVPDDKPLAQSTTPQSTGSFGTAYGGSVDSFSAAEDDIPF